MIPLNLIIKTDVQGTAEAISYQLKKLSNEQIDVHILYATSGIITENDVNVAASSVGTTIIGFYTKADQKVLSLAKKLDIDIRIYKTIYQITDDVKQIIQNMIKPIEKEILIGTAEIRQLFKSGKKLIIAGCMVTSGKVQRSAIARIVREGKVIYEGKIETLKRFKDDVREVAQGFECGMSFEKFADVLEGDIVNAYIITQKA